MVKVRLGFEFFTVYFRVVWFQNQKNKCPKCVYSQILEVSVFGVILVGFLF